MGNCFFFKYSPRSKSQPVSEPANIQIPERVSEGSIINPHSMHIDLIIEGELPLNLLSNGRNNSGTEISVDSPHKTPKVPPTLALVINRVSNRTSSCIEPSAKRTRSSGKATSSSKYTRSSIRCIARWRSRTCT